MRVATLTFPDLSHDLARFCPVMVPSLEKSLVTLTLPEPHAEGPAYRGERGGRRKVCSDTCPEQLPRPQEEEEEEEGDLIKALRRSTNATNGCRVAPSRPALRAGSGAPFPRILLRRGLLHLGTGDPCGSHATASCLAC